MTIPTKIEDKELAKAIERLRNKVAGMMPGAAAEIMSDILNVCLAAERSTFEGKTAEHWGLAYKALKATTTAQLQVAKEESKKMADELSKFRNKYGWTDDR